MPRQTLTEARPTADATPVEGSQGRFRVQLITPGWGSSGYYSTEVLEAAAKSKAFAKGMHAYLDHPTRTEEHDRPERSVRDLAAVLAEDARWTGSALEAEVTVFGPYRKVLDEMKDAIGVSIRAAAEVEQGEAEGRKGLIVSDILEGISSDFVTHAGRGGRIVEVLESARATLAEAVSDKAWSGFKASDYSDEQWARACIMHVGDGNAKADWKLPVREPQGALNRNGCHAAASVLGGGRGGVGGTAEQKKTAAKKLVGLYRNQLDEDPPESLLKAAGMKAQESGRMDSERREQMANLVRDAHGDRDNEVFVWLRDYDETDVYFERYGGQQSGTFRQAYSEDDDGTITLTGDPVEVRAVIQYVPVNPPAGQTTTQESEEDTMPQIEEARLRQLEEAFGRVTTLESERDTAVRERDEARTERDQLREAANAGTVARIVGEAAREALVELDEMQTAGLSVNPPMSDNGGVDEEALRKRVDEALAKAKEKQGAGTVRGFGGTTTSTTQEAQQLREASDNARRTAFGRPVEKQGA